MESSIETIIGSFILIVVILWSLSSIIYLAHYMQIQSILNFLNSCAEEIAFTYANSNNLTDINLQKLCDGKLGNGVWYYVEIKLIEVVNYTILTNVKYQFGQRPAEFVNKANYCLYQLNGNLTITCVYTYE